LIKDVNKYVENKHLSFLLLRMFTMWNTDS